jgi:hypothetical protein
MIMCVDCESNFCSDESSTASPVCPAYQPSRVGADTDYPMVVNPCESCYNGRSTYAVLGWTVDTQILYPEIRNISISDTSLRSIDIALNVSSPGWVFCDAFATGYEVSSVTEVTTGNYYDIAFSADEEVTVKIDGLVPDTNYTTYCYTENFLSNTMPLSSVLATNLTAHTACCREAYFQHFVSRRQNDSMDIYSYALDALPLEDTTLDIDVSPTTPCVHTEGSITPVATAYPARATFRPQARGLGFIPTQRFIVKGTPGCYNVTLSTSSGSFFQGEERRLILTSSNNNPLPPALSSAQFSHNPSKIMVTFDAPTDKAVDSVTLSPRGTFVCTQLFDASGGTMNGLAQSQCRWSSSFYAHHHSRQGRPHHRRQCGNRR